MARFIIIFLIFLLVGCATPRSKAYREMYAHLNIPCASLHSPSSSDNYLIIFVNARHLDYTDCHSFLRTMCKHPSDSSKNRDVGHAWIYLHGIIDGEEIVVYGGHSGELGARTPRYLDGIMNYLETGYPHLNAEECNSPRYEPNPVKYLWEPLDDGYFECGSGGHRATFAAKVNVDEEQLRRILDFIRSYRYTKYSLVENQCSTFVVQVASLAGVDLECEVTIPIDSTIYWRGEAIPLWCDPSYSQLTVATPDMIEKSLMQSVRDGRAEYYNEKTGIL